jgi:predicted acyltransferase
VRGQVIVLVTILLGYWLLLTKVAVPGGIAGDLSKEHNLAGWVDMRFLPGKIYDAYYGFGDNEGLLSTIPAVGTALLGVLAGQVLRSWWRPSRKILGLVAMGAVCLGLGWAWSFSFPLIKNLWTSSFVLVAGGFSLLLLALFYAVVDVMGWKRRAFFFIVIGSNAITIYLASSIIDFAAISQFFLGGVIRLSGGWGPVILAAGVIAAEWVFLLFLYRHKIYLRV